MKNNTHNSTPLRVRIAPSPTGSPHIGTARAALFNYLFARHGNGMFIVRIEDTDTERSEKKYESEILEGLRWLGIDADESPEVSGPYAPYRSSERLHIYKTLLHKLLHDGHAFTVFIAKKSSPQNGGSFSLKKNLPSTYAHTARLSFQKLCHSKIPNQSQLFASRCPAARLLRLMTLFVDGLNIGTIFSN